jgi:hypothetical protein
MTAICLTSAAVYRSSDPTKPVTFPRGDIADAEREW